MSTATVLTSAMSGMPVLKGTEGSLAAVIRYIAPILGWEIMFDNGPEIVIRPQSYKGGQSLLYRFDDRAARGGLATRVAEVKAYESMSDIYTGAGLIGTTYIHKACAANTVANAYTICGDSYGFYIHSCDPYGGTTPIAADILSYFGFDIPILPTDTPICVLLGSADTTALGRVYATACAVIRDVSIASTPNCFLHKNAAGSLGIAASLIVNGGPHIGNKCLCHFDNVMPSYTGTLLYGRPYLNDGAAYTCRAYLPGLYYPCHLYADITALNMHSFKLDKVLNIDGRSFVTAFIATQTVGAEYGWGYALFDIGEGFRP